MPKCSEIKIADGHLYVNSNLLAKKPHYFGVIYLLRSPSGKYYIGQTIQHVEKRWKDYRRLNCKSQSKLFNALRKYGSNNFVFKVIDFCENKEEMDDKEKFYIKNYDSIKNGYNHQIGGRGQYQSSNKTKNQRGEGKVFYWTGKHHSDETKRKLSLQRIGRRTKPHTEEWKKVLSEKMMGNSYGKFLRGIKISKELVEKRRNNIAREWKLIDPVGNIFNIKNLKQFCLQHKLNTSLMVATSKGKRNHHQGWKAVKIT